MQAKTDDPVAGNELCWDSDAPDPYLRHLYAPLSSPDGRTVLATGNPSRENRAWLKTRYGDDATIAPCSPRAILPLIEKRFRDVFARAAVSELLDHEPQFSASTVITTRQSIVFVLLATAAALACCIAPAWSRSALTALLCVLFTANGLFRAVLFCVGARERPAANATTVAGDDLPLYTILVPLYREARVMPSLVRALSALDYPGMLAQTPQEI